jgi:ABC-type sugar transport system ATPase subunit
MRGRSGFRAIRGLHYQGEIKFFTVVAFSGPLIYFLELNQDRNQEHAAGHREGVRAVRHAQRDHQVLAANMFLGRWPRKGLFVDKGAMEREADGVLKRLKVDANSVRQRVESLSGGRQQSVAIARAIAFLPKVIVLDEPTANLSVVATKRLLETMTELKNHGVAQAIISHRLQDIFEVGDRVVFSSAGAKLASATSATPT